MNADLRPIFYRIQGSREGMCVHPYDLGAVLIARVGRGDYGWIGRSTGRAAGCGNFAALGGFFQPRAAGAWNR